MAGRTLRRRVGFALCALWVCIGAPAFAQTKLDYRSASPRALLQALQIAPREEQDAIAAALVARRAQVLPALRDSARSGAPREKVLALSLLVEMRDRDGVDAMVAASRDADVLVRRRAATTLRIMADPRSAARLRELVQTESDLGVRKSAVVALGRLGQRQDVVLIAPLLGAADDGLRVVAAGALAMLGDERGLRLVLAATNHSDPGVQKSATYALGLFRASAAGERLQAILDDPNGAWKSYALIAQAERRLALQSTAEQIESLDTLARGRSRSLAAWAVDRLTDIGSADAVDVLRKVRDRPAPVGPLAERRLSVLEARP